MNKRTWIQWSMALGLCLLASTSQAQVEPFKVGLLLPMSGPFASTGKQLLAGVQLYLAENGSTVAGRKIELIVKDDNGVPDITKRLAQELVAASSLIMESVL